MGLFFDPTLNFTQPNVQQFIDNLAALKQDDVTEAPAQETTTYKVSETYAPYHAEIEEIQRELRRSQVRIMRNITKYPYKNSKSTFSTDGNWKHTRRPILVFFWKWTYLQRIQHYNINKTSKLRNAYQKRYSWKKLFSQNFE